MRALIQRCKKVELTINSSVFSSINEGLLILLGIGYNDNEKDIEWLSGKISRLRIFNDDEGKMNLSVQDISGEIMVVSQFTLYASTKKGNRPSYIESAPPETAIPLYESFIKKIKEDSGVKITTGEFGADMKISLVNDGPVTIIIDSKARE
ncbi:MAG: D-tyrosyl-tRNA(Tyr) deacylase [Saprospiraceae bacterium]|nr:D-tyrosyl-tRNA(Tyr) deacylase [Saprospiraceae bacterium]